MELRHMRHFVAVAEERHFGKAAKRLNMAQPPLSQSIRRLEDDLGVQLFDRSHRGSTELTPAGQAFFGEAKRALMFADLARTLARREVETNPNIRIGFVGPALYRLLPGLLVDFRNRAPEVQVHLFEELSPAQARALSAGERDVAFVSGDQQSIDGCERVVVETTSLAAAVPADWALAEKTSITLAELATYPFIRPPSEKYEGKSEDVLSIFKNAGLMPYVTQEATHAFTTLTLVNAGLGCTLTTATANLNLLRNVRFIPIAFDDAPAPWTLDMVWRPRPITKATAAFVQLVLEHVRLRPELMAV